MEKREWRKPDLENLEVSKTEFGTTMTSQVDDTTYINGHTYYSFS